MVAMQAQAPRGVVPAKHPRAFLFWMLAAAITLLVYWACLRFLQPGYFSPDSVFHIDFYDYAGMRMKSAIRLLLKYPRPVAFLSMKALGYGGLYGTMMGSAALALLNLLLTVFYVRRRFALHSPWLLLALGFYLLLNIAHPQFYMEHRHDQPAQVSYFFLMLSLIAWTAWLDMRDGERRRLAASTFALLVAAGSAVAFAFSKETYFLAALCLLAGLAFSEPTRRFLHFSFAGFVLIVEVASLLWTRHVNSPFINPNAAAESTYRINVSPVSVIETFLFYAYHLVIPAAGIAVVISLVYGIRKGIPALHAVVFPVAAVAALAPHALLPNHKFPEYAWAGAPLLLTPVLFLGAGAFDRKSLRLPMLAVAALSAFAVGGPGGYTSRYHTEEQVYVRHQEKLNGRIVASFAKFRSVPRPSRILVTGLNDPIMPWQVADYIRSEFGDEVYWTIVLPPEIQARRPSRVTAFTDPADVQLTDFDYVAMYSPSGELVDMRRLDKSAIPRRLPASYVPALAALMDGVAARPGDPGALLDVAAAALEWGFVREAADFLARAENVGGARDERFRNLSERASALMAREQAAKATTAKLTANPQVIQSDGSGLGVTEVSWQAPDGMAIEVHVDSPDGPMVAAATTSGRAKTDKWVRDGTEFFLQNVTGGKPLTRSNTLATVKVSVRP